MGREVRMVRADWKHPTTDGKENYIPLHEDSFTAAQVEWDEAKRQWDAGLRRDYSKDGIAFKPKDVDDTGTYEEYAGDRPTQYEYMPDWKPEERTHFQMYETCTEGTPISPVMETPEALARWLADNGASSFGSSTASYEAWLSTIKRGWAPSGVVIAGSGKGLQSGVEGLAD